MHATEGAEPEMPEKPSPRVTGALVVAGVDIARHLVRAWTAHREAEASSTSRLAEDLGARGGRLRARSQDAARRAASHAPPSVQRRLPEWSRPAPWYSAHRSLLLATALVAALAAAAVAVATTGRRLAGAPPLVERTRGAALDVHERAVRGESPIRTSIDAGGAATIAAIDAVASDTSAAATAAKVAATDEVHHRIVEPAKAKATRIGALAIAGLTLYIVVVSALVQLLVTWLA